MAKDRNGFRRHVRAAKEWLGETEASLDNSEELKGDLSFMLARAELQRAGEVKAQKDEGRHFTELAALLLVCLLAGAWLLWRQPAEELPQTPAGLETTAVRKAGGVQATSQQEEKAAPELVHAVPEARSAPEEQAREEQEEEKAPEETARDAGAAPPARPAVEEKTTIPEEGLQRLMNEAGRSLRAQ